MKRIFLPFLVLFASFPTGARPKMPEAVILDQGADMIVELGTGLWGIPLPLDYDGDGVNDLLSACPDTPYQGIYYFHNSGTNSKPVFEPAVKLCDRTPNNLHLSYVAGRPRLLGPGTEYAGFPASLLSSPVKIEYEGSRLGSEWNKFRSHIWTYADWDGDGDTDIIVGIDTWQFYGWDDAWDANGVWKNGNLVGRVNLLENVDGKYVNRGMISAGGEPILTEGAPSPCVADFDGDGDMDLICGEFVDGLTWFENRGGSFTDGHRLSGRKGDFRFHVAMITPVAFDWDGDGRTDLLVGDEDGTVCLLRNTGKTRRCMPLFEEPVKFMQKADRLKFGALSTPWSYDWDGDGQDDIIAGNSAGEIAFIKNLGDGKAWDAPKLFTVGRKPWRILAGANGSIQGPIERKWGYTVLSVADWDGDGRPDIIFNSIWGKIEWMRGLGGLRLAAPRPVEVVWEGKTPMTDWNWWTPAPGTLATQWRTTPVAIDWNNDGLQDLVVLDTEGYLAFFERLSDGRLAPGKRIFTCTNGSVYDNRKGIVDKTPGILRLNALRGGQSGRRKICFADWNRDGFMDLIVDGRYGAALFLGGKTRQDGLYPLTHAGALSSTKLEGHTTSPTAVDWDRDGVSDILVGAEDGHFYILRNTLFPL